MRTIRIPFIGILLGLLLVLGGVAAYATGGPHWNEADGCNHGNSHKPCRPDPQPSHGKDCLVHGNHGGINEDHCGSTGTPTTPTGTPTTTPGGTPSDTKTHTPHPTKPTTPYPTTATPHPTTVTSSSSSSSSTTVKPHPSPSVKKTPTVVKVTSSRTSSQPAVRGTTSTPRRTPVVARHLAFTGIGDGLLLLALLGIVLVGIGYALNRRK